MIQMPDTITDLMQRPYIKGFSMTPNTSTLSAGEDIAETKGQHLPYYSHQFVLSVEADAVQLAELQTWHRDTLKRGALPFYWGADILLNQSVAIAFGEAIFKSGLTTTSFIANEIYAIEARIDARIR